VWTYLRDGDRPYCNLYDLGYTSLGTTKNTVPNEQLRKPDGSFRCAQGRKKEKGGGKA